MEVTTNALGAQSRWVGVCLDVKSVKAIAAFEQRYSPVNRGLCRMYYKTVECLRRRFVGLMVTQAQPRIDNRGAWENPNVKGQLSSKMRVLHLPCTLAKARMETMNHVRITTVSGMYWFVFRLGYIDKLFPVLVSCKVGGTHLRRCQKRGGSLQGNRKVQGGTRPGSKKKREKISAQPRSLEIRERLRKDPFLTGEWFGLKGAVPVRPCHCASTAADSNHTHKHRNDLKDYRIA